MDKVIKFSEYIKENAPAAKDADSTIELSLKEIEDLFYAAHIAYKGKKKNPVLKTIESEAGSKLNVVLTK